MAQRRRFRAEFNREAVELTSYGRLPRLQAVAYVERYQPPRKRIAATDRNGSQAALQLVFGASTSQ
jgi:hypothetical protein